MTLDDRINRALALRGEGYNCSQCVAMAFSDVTGLDDEIAAKLSSGFGSGFAGQQQLCGAVAGMGIASGWLTWTKPSDKAAVYKVVSLLADEFKEINGSIVCGELKRPGRKPCPRLIADAVTILHNCLNSDK